MVSITKSTCGHTYRHISFTNAKTDIGESPDDGNKKLVKQKKVKPSKAVI